MSLDKWKHLQFIALEWRLRFKVFPVVQNLQHPPITVVNLGTCKMQWQVGKDNQSRGKHEFVLSTKDLAHLKQPGIFHRFSPALEIHITCIRTNSSAWRASVSTVVCIQKATTPIILSRISCMETQGHIPGNHPQSLASRPGIDNVPDTCWAHRAWGTRPHKCAGMLFISREWLLN